jgi:hypothetical protein
MLTWLTFSGAVSVALLSTITWRLAENTWFPQYSSLPQPPSDLSNLAVWYTRLIQQYHWLLHRLSGEKADRPYTILFSTSITFPFAKFCFLVHRFKSAIILRLLHRLSGEKADRDTDMLTNGQKREGINRGSDLLQPDKFPGYCWGSTRVIPAYETVHGEFLRVLG